MYRDATLSNPAPPANGSTEVQIVYTSRTVQRNARVKNCPPMPNIFSIRSSVNLVRVAPPHPASGRLAMILPFPPSTPTHLRRPPLHPFTKPRLLRPQKNPQMNSTPPPFKNSQAPKGNLFPSEEILQIPIRLMKCPPFLSHPFRYFPSRAHFTCRSLS